MSYVGFCALLVVIVWLSMERAYDLGRIEGLIDCRAERTQEPTP